MLEGLVAVAGAVGATLVLHCATIEPIHLNVTGNRFTSNDAWISPNIKFDGCYFLMPAVTIDWP